MYRFTIRDLLWVTMVVAVGVAFYMQRVDNAKLRELLAIANRRSSLWSYRLEYVGYQLELKGYDLRWDDESGTQGLYYIEPPLPQATRAPQPSDGH